MPKVVSTSSFACWIGSKCCLMRAIERRIAILCRMAGVASRQTLFRDGIRTDHMQDAPARTSTRRRQQDLLDLRPGGKGATIEKDVIHSAGAPSDRRPPPASRACTLDLVPHCNPSEHPETTRRAHDLYREWLHPGAPPGPAPACSCPSRQSGKQYPGGHRCDRRPIPRTGGRRACAGCGLQWLPPQGCE